MENYDYENEIKELKKQLKKAERKIKTLEADNSMLVAFNKKATLIRDNSERELLSAKTRAELADKAKSDFLASMSHEIRTPINAVLGMNELIMRESSEPQIVEYAADIKSSGRMLLSIINDILDFSKIESGKMEIIPVEYDLSSIINDIINMLSKRAKDKGLLFDISVDESIPVILYGDELRIRQIITNLLTNAIKYTDKGKISLTITGHKSGDLLDLKIVISDTGKGIKPEDQSKLFNSFTRVDEKENRTIEGTGLGLALTKGFVDMMGGDLSFESEYQKGSSFTVVISQRIVNDSPIGNLSDRIKKNRASTTADEYDIYAPDCSILVVDDVEMNIKVMCGLLKNTGISIDTSTSGIEALELCRNKKYDLIFMDHRMPNMDGLECFDRLRQMNTPNNSTPVIILTANALSGMREMYLSKGFSDYLTKPIEARKLVAAFRRIVPELIKNRDSVCETAPEITIDSKASSELTLQEKYPELNIETGLAYCMNSEDFYREMLKEYVKSSRIPALHEAYNNRNFVDFKTHVHGVKSTSLTLGAITTSEKAKALEAAAVENNIEFIKEHFEEFIKEYEALINKIIKNEGL